jgi:hypothetical protein
MTNTPTERADGRGGWVTGNHGPAAPEYDHTIVGLHEGRAVSAEVAVIDDDGYVLRANGHWIPGGVMNTRRYHDVWRIGHPASGVRYVSLPGTSYYALMITDRAELTAIALDKGGEIAA